MIRRAALRERLFACGMLVLCACCCLAIAEATVRLEAANEKRRGQLQLLEGIAAAAERLSPGPVAELDGLYGRRLAVVATEFGPSLAFATGGPVRNTEVPR
jgi:hypothetical protein